MISNKNLTKIREILNKSSSPLFFFDNDTDGLTSYLLLRRFCNKGKGVVIKSYPDLNVSYIRKVTELNPDLIVILDKPLVSESFINLIKEKGIEILWIDHHPPENIPEDIHYFNPLNEEKYSTEPVCYWCYQISRNINDIWLGILGCLGDSYMPDFASEFSKKFPDLLPEECLKEIRKAMYESQIGYLMKVLSFSLKDRTTNVIKMLKILGDVKDIYELIGQNNKTKQIYKRFEQVNRKYQKLLDKAKIIGNKSGGVLFFQYGGELSLSGELANELMYYFPEKIIVVCYMSGTYANISARNNPKSGGDLREILNNALLGVEHTCGGHKNACGAKVLIEDIPKFRDNLIKVIK